MVYEFKFPDVGEGITEGEIVEWFVKEGDEVEEHQALGKIETAKAIVEIPSPRTGKIVKINHKAGETVKVGETLVVIAEKGEASKKTEERKAPEQKKAFGVVGELPEELPSIPTRPLVCLKCGARFDNENILNKHLTMHKGEIREKKEILATPAVRRIARDLGVDLSTIQGTGPEGRILEEDIKKHAIIPQVRVVKKYDMYGYVDRIPLKGIRKVTAQRMRESLSQNAPVTTFDEADVSKLWDHREKEKKKAEKQKIHLTFLPFIVKALIDALKEFPSFNASYDEEHEEIIIKKYYNIGVAVDTPDGLIVPIVKGADQKDVYQIAKEIEDFAEKAKNRKVDLADLRGNSFTITNVGVIGGIFATPIINPPDVAILLTGKIYDKAVVIDGKVQVRKVLPLSLTFDHRINDGANAQRFMNKLKEYLENSEQKSFLS